MLKLDGSVPAAFVWRAPAISLPSLAQRVLAALLRWHDRANARFRLRELDDRQLRDVGLTRRAIETPLPYRPWD